MYLNYYQNNYLFLSKSLAHRLLYMKNLYRRGIVPHCFDKYFMTFIAGLAGIIPVLFRDIFPSLPPEPLVLLVPL